MRGGVIAQYAYGSQSVLKYEESARNKIKIG